MNRISIIQNLINRNHYKSYLEIGVRDGSCFNAIKCENKIGVDPDPSSAANRIMTSDSYFGENIESIPGNLHKFDIIFIDGLHHSEQVIKDIENSLKSLNEGGTIVMHDCLPTSEFMQRIPMQSDHNEWTGDTWKAYLKFRREREDLEMMVVDCDWGCGIIRPGKQTKVITDENPTYEEFYIHKNIWMNVISVDEFKAKFLD